MSDETPGAGQNAALLPREGQGVAVARTSNAGAPDRPTVRLTQVAGGQYVLTSQSTGVPALAQISPGPTLYSSANLVQGNVARIINISPSRIVSGAQLRPSLANQSIVNVLTKSRPNPRIQLFPNTATTSGSAADVSPLHPNTNSSPFASANASSLTSTASTSSVPAATQVRGVKRPAPQISSSAMQKKEFAAKLERVTNHKLVRSKYVKEQYNEHLMENYHLEIGGNSLDLYQFAKKPRTQQFLQYAKENAIDPKEEQEKNDNLPNVVPSQSIPNTPPVSVVATSTPEVVPTTPVTTTSVKQKKTPSFAASTSASSSTLSNNNQEQIVEKAKQEAYVVQRIADLQKEGLWSERRLPKVQEMQRAKAHWDYLLEEMVWLAADFAQERKWKKAAAKKCARMVQKYFQDKALAAQRAEKAQEQHLRRIASYCAKEIKNFWNNVEKLVEYKQNTILEEKRKKALDQQLSFIVDQTEKYSQLLAEGMNKSNLEVSRSSSRAKAHSDDEFEPVQSDEDDEETIEKEESQVEIVDQKEEIDALQRESQMELDDLLEDDLLRNYLMNRDNIKISESDEDDVESSSSDEEEDDESSEEEEQDSEESGNTAEEEQKDELKMLVEDERDSKTEGQTSDKDDLINDAAAIAESIQPKGNTLSSTTVSTKVPFLLKFPLREYQHIGLDWLVTMYERKLNGILADEMGLGKTIQTIALLAHLACEKENWGPHLIVVPTSVMLNWEMELKKWCPAFKILTYYGTQKERKLKRTGWTKPNAFHVCITSYKLVIQDHQSFRRKKWKYLILDEAQNIKNFKSQRWQLLLNFQTQQRLLLTGTPLQNNLMELWSLMHFLMPNVFQSHREFKEWFSNPVTGMIEGNSEYNESIIKRLHKVLRPFLLRRLKSEVEKQMPKKYEHVVMCRLSKRQRFLYDDYMSRAKTKETLTSGNLLSVINVLMQLRKVCNHPNLFEIRPTISPFQCEGIRLHVPSLVYSALEYDVWQHVSIMHLNMLIIMLEMQLSAYQCYRARQLRTPSSVFEAVAMNCRPNSPPPYPPGRMNMRVVRVSPEVAEAVKNEKKDLKEVAAAAAAAAATASKIVPLSAVQQQNLVKGSYKMTPQYGVQLVSSQGVVKTIPVVNISQATAAAAAAAANANTSGVTSVLKPADKINASFAQLVQTSIGKHLLLTSNPNITGGNIPVTATTAGGQKLTFFSKQPVSTSNASNVVTKAIVKFQLTSVTTATTSTNVTTSSTTAMSEAAKDDSRKTIGVKFIDQLYANQSNNLDVRWGEGGEPTQKSDENEELERKRRCELMARVNERRCTALPLYGRDFQDCIKIFIPNKFNTWTGGRIHCLNTLFKDRLSSVNDIQTTDALDNIMYNPEKRIRQIKDISDRFIFYVPAVKAPEPEMQVWHPPPSKYWGQMADNMVIKRLFSKPATPLHHIASAMVTQFPDPRLIQYDCGKLQTLDRLLRKLKQGNHRVLIFTQMTKMLDVLEAFLNFHGHIYLRLDGSTKVDQRQVLMERFNGDTRIFAFILSTRSGGIGVNLTGADTVIFYDSDWNPTMDAQAQDRCHRIGQTRDVHIYRLISERTIEENILKKANQKRLLGDLAIEGGNFTTAYFKSSTIQDLFNIDQNEESAATRMSEVVDISKEREKQRQQSAEPTSAEDKSSMGALEQALAACEDDQDVIAARTAKAEAVADLAEFDETIPLEEQEKEKEPEMSKAEQEIDNVIKKLSPIERYAMKFIEETESAWSAEQLRAAEREIEEQKREWEQNRLAAMREEEERRARELEEEETNMLTFSREDAMNQVSNKKKQQRKLALKKGSANKVSNQNSKNRRVVVVSKKFKAKSQMINRNNRGKKFAVVNRKKVARTRQSSLKVENESDNSQNEEIDTKLVKENKNTRKTPAKDTKTSDKESRKVKECETNGDDNAAFDENSVDSTQSESNLSLATIKAQHSPINHVDHNSPRTRSRGTVSINLWTLDVSPILPGVKPIKKSSDTDLRKTVKRKSLLANDGKTSEDEEGDEGKNKKIRTRSTSDNEEKPVKIKITSPKKSVNRKKLRVSLKNMKKDVKIEIEKKSIDDNQTKTQEIDVESKEIHIKMESEDISDDKDSSDKKDNLDINKELSELDENDKKVELNENHDDQLLDENKAEINDKPLEISNANLTNEVENTENLDAPPEIIESKPELNHETSANDNSTTTNDRKSPSPPNLSPQQEINDDMSKDLDLSLTNSSHLDNGIDRNEKQIKKNERSRFRTTTTVNKKLMKNSKKSNNQTLDSWITVKKVKDPIKDEVINADENKDENVVNDSEVSDSRTETEPLN